MSKLNGNCPYGGGKVILCALFEAVVAAEWLKIS
jgi:hypothetical protein